MRTQKTPPLVGEPMTCLRVTIGPGAHRCMRTAHIGPFELHISYVCSRSTSRQHGRSRPPRFQVLFGFEGFWTLCFVDFSTLGPCLLDVLSSFVS